MTSVSSGLGVMRDAIEAGEVGVKGGGEGGYDGNPQRKDDNLL